MNKTCILPWLLAGTLALSACGGGTSAGSWVESSASQPPAQSAAASLPTQPDASRPDGSQPDASQPDVSQPDGSQPGSSSASSSQQQADASQAQQAPPAVVSKPQVTSKPQITSKPQTPAQDNPSSSQEAPADPEPAASSNPEPPSAPTKADAQAYIGKSVSSLIAAIGAPKGSDYAPSCLGDGEDGELFYDGFTVYTYRLNGTETVQDVV